MYFLWYIIIGILAGFVAGKFMRGGGFGLFTNLLVGVVGGVRSAGNRNDRSVGQSDNFNCRSCRFVVDCFIV